MTQDSPLTWDDLKPLAEELIRKAAEKGIMIATAESCTGGLITGLLTEISGSSAVVDRGFVTYSNDAKMDMLGVEAATLMAHGAVSRETALEMAEGALANSRAALTMAVTGIAGPGGGTADKPVGTVHLAIGHKGTSGSHHLLQLGDIGRDQVRLRTIEAALRFASNSI